MMSNNRAAAGGTTAASPLSANGKMSALKEVRKDSLRPLGESQKSLKDLKMAGPGLGEMSMDDSVQGDGEDEDGSRRQCGLGITFRKHDGQRGVGGEACQR